MSRARIQREKVLDHLRQGPLSTLQARNELFVMSIAARIFELKQRGFNIVTHYVMAGDKKIAQYVLLSGNES
ncbi:MAG: helix-turn-helix domain-containing protein [Methylobacter sp.]